MVQCICDEINEPFYILFYILWWNLLKEDDKVCLTLEEPDDEMVQL